MFSLVGRKITAPAPEVGEVGSSNGDVPSDRTADAAADALERGAADPCDGVPICQHCSGDVRRQHVAATRDPPSTGDATSNRSQQQQLQPDEDEMYFRPLQETDYQAIKALHEEWFPVRYKEDFYDNVVHNRLAGSGDPLFSCVACVGGDSQRKRRRRGGNGGVGGTTDSSFGIDEEQQWNQVAQSLGIKFDKDEEYGAVGPEIGTTGRHTMQIQSLDEEFTDDERGANFDPSQAVDVANTEKIAGCIVGAFLDTKRCNRKSAELLVPDPERYRKIFYIMTLGVMTEYRHRGLATKLVEKCIRLVESEPRCGALYLHVITYNEAAIRFYEKLGFSRVEEIEDYYNIDGQHYNCYLYARYFHGNQGHFTLYYVVSNLIITMWRRVSAPVYSVFKT